MKGQLIARVLRVYVQREGVSQSTGMPWQRVVVVAEAEGESYALETMNENIIKHIADYCQVGTWVQVRFLIHCREFGDTWFTSLRILSIAQLNATKQ